MINKRKSYRNKFELKNKVAVVTGGLGVLGREFSAGLADFGAKVAIIDIDKDLVEKFADQLKKEFGVDCIGVCCDVSDLESVNKMVNTVENKLGPIDILHNNAATKGKSLEDFLAPLEDYLLDTWREVMSVNLDGMFLVARAVGLKMAKRGYGSIIQTSSIYGPTMGPDNSIYKDSYYMEMSINTPPVYPASKGGVVALTNYFATYWAEKGVRVNTLTPGGVESGQNDTFLKRYSDRVPMKRMANRSEMVGALIFLASDASSYITGQNIFIDGGLSAW
jgi:NAD(P)-dependent dehydrogenase (short-subunit alcohol dehydrogenase family)